MPVPSPCASSVFAGRAIRVRAADVVVESRALGTLRPCWRRPRRVASSSSGAPGAIVPRPCAPAKGWEKGSVEGGVKYVRNLVFRPRLAVESWTALNAAIITELDADLPTRQLDDGRSVEEALAQERQRLRAMPAHLPATCRVVARVADKFGHVRVDRVTYSVPIRHAYRPVWAKLYHDRVAIAVGAEVVAEHPRAFVRGAKVLDALHVLPLLERKHRAVAEATALHDWRLAPVWQRARAELAKHTRKPDQEWVRMLRLMETHPAPAVERAANGARPPFAAPGDGAAHPPSASQWRRLAEQAARQRQAPADYLAQLVHLEVTGRRERRIQRRIQDALAPDDQRMPNVADIERRFGGELNKPSLESMLVCLILGVSPNWRLADFERIVDGYFEQRTRKNGLRLPRAFEAGVLLHAAEQYRLDGDIRTARTLLSQATECHPGHQPLREIEESVGSNTPIDWLEVVFPGSANRKSDADSTPGAA